MQLIGQAIRHETFGKGIVTGWNRNILTVCFPGETSGSSTRTHLPGAT
ncbi:MAG: hypothetical protein ACLUJG_02870 [Lawsonibacter sp.]